MNSKLELAQDKFIEGIGKLCDSFGLNRFVAQLYGLLYLSQRPLSLDDIVEQLKVSKGNVSLNIRELEKWGAARNVWVKGSRKDYYEAELDIKRVVSNKLKSSIQRRLAEVSNMVDEFNKIVCSTDGELTKEEKELTKVYEERIKKIESLKDLVSNTLGLAEKFI